MLTNPEYLKAKAYLVELKQYNDELHKLWKQDPDPFDKRREIYKQPMAEVHTAIKDEFGCSAKELKAQVKEYESQNKTIGTEPPHHETELGRRQFEPIYDKPPAPEKPEPTLHVAEHRLFDRYKTSDNAERPPEKQVSPDNESAYKKLYQQPHHEPTSPSRGQARDLNFEQDPKNR
jgi:hypothetical protein